MEQHDADQIAKVDRAEEDRIKNIEEICVAQELHKKWATNLNPTGNNDVEPPEEHKKYLDSKFDNVMFPLRIQFILFLAGITTQFCWSIIENLPCFIPANLYPTYCIR